MKSPITVVVINVIASFLEARAESWQQELVTGTAPAPRYSHSEIWTGTELIIWGGTTSVGNYSNTGGRYNPSTNTWRPINTAEAPTGRISHTAMWTGTEMIVWGGFDGSGVLNSGGRYNPASNSWSSLSAAAAPAPRTDFAAVWTGGEMIVWGGSSSGTGSGPLNSGGRYNPATNIWQPVSTAGAPAARMWHTAVWADGKMIIWGGYGGGASGGTLNTGGRYDPATDTWSATGTTAAPAARRFHTAVWTNSEMLVWGGEATGGDVNLNTGGRYNPATNTWLPISLTGSPRARSYHSSIWTGNEMIVWGGYVGPPTGRESSGARYNPATNSWVATSNAEAPAARSDHSAVWTGREMIVWGGFSGGNGTFAYIPYEDTFRIISAVFDGGNLVLSFPGASGRNYSLWQSNSLAGGWTNAGVTAVPVTGGILAFSVPGLTVNSKFFRVQAGP